MCRCSEKPNKDNPTWNLTIHCCANCGSHIATKEFEHEDYNETCCGKYIRHPTDVDAEKEKAEDVIYQRKLDRLRFSENDSTAPTADVSYTTNATNPIKRYRYD